MSAIKIYCLKKNRDRNGAIVEYLMSDERGDTGCFDRKGVIALIKDKKYDVVNLQIDKLGRVVDKEVKDEEKIIDGISKLSKSTNINDIFDAGYGFLLKMGMIIIIRNSKGEIKMTEPFDRIKSGVDIDKLMVEFEKFVMNKYNTRMLKIDTLNNRTGRRYVVYGIGYVEDYPRPEDIKNAESVSHYTIKCQGEYGKKIIGRKKIKSGEIIDDAYLGTILLDTRNKEAVAWAKKRVSELEKHLLSKSSSTNDKDNTSQSGINLKK